MPTAYHIFEFRSRNGWAKPPWFCKGGDDLPEENKTPVPDRAVYKATKRKQRGKI